MRERMHRETPHRCMSYFKNKSYTFQDKVILKFLFSDKCYKMFQCLLVYLWVQSSNLSDQNMGFKKKKKVFMQRSNQLYIIVGSLEQS